MDYRGLIEHWERTLSFFFCKPATYPCTDTINSTVLPLLQADSCSNSYHTFYINTMPHIKMIISKMSYSFNSNRVWPFGYLWHSYPSPFHTLPPSQSLASTLIRIQFAFVSAKKVFFMNSFVHSLSIPHPVPFIPHNPEVYSFIILHFVYVIIVRCCLDYLDHPYRAHIGAVGSYRTCENAVAAVFVFRSHRSKWGRNWSKNRI